MATQHGARGRPTASDRATIEEAACELFLEQGYAATSVSDIARRAGISRSSFFNYFDGKGEVLWWPVTCALARLDDDLDALVADDAATPVDTLCDGLETAAALVGTEAIPLAVANAEAMDVRDELALTGGALQLALGRRLAGTLTRLGLDERARASVAGSAIAGALGAAVTDWAASGPGRGPLASRVRDALAPLRAGFRCYAPAQ